MYAPGHLGELTQIIDPELVDAVVEGTGARERRRHLLPTRVVVYFVLALAFFERSSDLAVWEKLTAGLGPLAVDLGCGRRGGLGDRAAICPVRVGSAAAHGCLWTAVEGGHGPVESRDRGPACR
ncbi:transposase domain-containing protein [Streptomyces sp. NPDC047453]|uniref:transposase domain-containing protein n=1 Tax=Streptomyces sp. NPDC047453 TaxID=3154812 RepID=UPI0033FB5FCA